MEELIIELMNNLEEKISDESSINSIYNNLILKIYEFGHEELFNILSEESDSFQKCFDKYVKDNEYEDEYE